jgi:hypothetical protein
MVRISIVENEGIITVSLEMSQDGRQVYQQFTVPKQMFGDLMMVLLDEGYLT